jgi:hypothetical protein
MADYIQYVTGIESSTNNSYDFLVSGRDDYKSSSGVMIKNDTSSAPGLAIRMDSSDNAIVDHRSSADKSLSFRLHDHDTNTAIPLLTLLYDNKSSDINGAEITGRVKASQFYLGEADTRAPTNPGVYTNLDSAYTAHIKVNKGTDGTGGFAFTTHLEDGTLDRTHMLLNPNGTVLLPKYDRTQDPYDDENYAIAGFDAQGKLVRAYQQNRRFQSIESRTTSAESDKTDTAIRINEIIRRINSLSIFSTDMAEVVMTPGFTFPQAGLYIQDNGMTYVDGSFNAYVVYPDFKAYQLNPTTMMISGDPLTVPFDKSGWSRVGDFIENDTFSITTYYDGTPLQQVVQKMVERFSSATQYKGLAPWSGAKWKSVIQVR